MYTVVVMPAYNAARTLEQTYQDIPKDIVNKIILVDDDSHDDTVSISKKLGIYTLAHKTNLGYGGNQKTCYTEALLTKADIVIMLHPDYQYDPKFIPSLIEPIKSGQFDIMLGSRITTRREVLDGGMPIYKYLGNRLLTVLENSVLKLHLSEYHTGYRAYNRKVLETLPFHSSSNDFVFDQEILLGACEHNFRIGEIHVPAKYFPEASSINFLRSVKYGFATLRCVSAYLTKRLFKNPAIKMNEVKNETLQ